MLNFRKQRTIFLSLIWVFGVFITCKLLLQIQTPTLNDSETVGSSFSQVKLVPKLKLKHNTKFRKIDYHERGYWSGADAGKYHAWRYGSGLSERLATFFLYENAKSVLDLGGGGGQYTQNLIRNGIFTSCYDGNPATQDASAGVCAVMDLTKPMNVAKHDWVLSLSVGRQIPPKLEQDFISNIHNLNTKGVVIYWGDGRPEMNDYPKSVRDNVQVTSKFLALGYTLDETASQYLRGRNSTNPNYSVLVFRKDGNVSNEGLRTNQPRMGLARNGNVINLAVTSCGSARLEEALTLVKSAILFSQHTQLRLFLFTDNGSLPTFSQRLAELAAESRDFHGNFTSEIRLADFPPDKEGVTPWKEMFKPCSLQRLFLPTLLPDEDALIYMDADSLILSNLTEFWMHFNSMNESQLIAATPATERGMTSWYQKRPQFPHYGERGLNTGITLMNLTRMRQVNFQELIFQVREKYEAVRPEETGDQFLQNILYNSYPEFVSLFPCDFNMRNLHCHCDSVYRCGCKSALENGAAVIHGTVNAFTDSHRLPFFKSIYEIIKEHDLAKNDMATLLKKLAGLQFEGNEHTCFFNSSKRFFKRTENYMGNFCGRSKPHSSIHQATTL